MKKGMQVKLKKTHWKQILRVYRYTTHEEQEAWYEKLHTECRAGRDVGYNCAGESKLAPRCTEN